MSNKKRIKKRIHSIQVKKNLLLFQQACHYATEIIKRTIEAIKRHYDAIKSYPIGGITNHNDTEEKVIDSHGDEMIIPKFKIQRVGDHFLDAHSYALQAMLKK